MRRIDYIAIHCSATREGQDYTVADIDRWHRGNGWTGIGYHYVIYRNGEIHSGRDIEKAGAHVANYNKFSIGICYIGGLDSAGRPKDTRTPEQKRALLNLLDRLKKQFPGAVIQGHRDFPGVTKACPCFDAKTEYADI